VLLAHTIFLPPVYYFMRMAFVSSFFGMLVFPCVLFHRRRGVGMRATCSKLLCFSPTNNCKSEATFSFRLTLSFAVDLAETP